MGNKRMKYLVLLFFILLFSCTLPSGDIYRTPEQQEAYEEWLKTKNDTLSIEYADSLVALMEGTYYRYDLSNRDNRDRENWNTVLFRYQYYLIDDVTYLNTPKMGFVMELQRESDSNFNQKEFVAYTAGSELKFYFESKEARTIHGYILSEDYLDFDTFEDIVIKDSNGIQMNDRDSWAIIHLLRKIRNRIGI